MSFARSLAGGVLAGAAGTAAMDYRLYRRYRSGGGKDSFWPWESAAAVVSWQEASSPGQLGQKIEHVIMARPPPDDWTRAPLTTVYKPICDYDARTLGDDLSAHLVYGAATSAVFAAFGHR